MKGNRWELWVVIAISILISLIYYFPILNSGNNLGIGDWDMSFSWTEYTRVSLIEYHQFPFWNPYKCGGSPQFANPQISVISLQTLFALIFGTLRGIKFSIYFHGVIGLIGFYFLAKEYRLSKLGSLLAAIIFSFSGITGSYLTTGMVVFTNFAYAPFILLFFNKGLQNWKWGIASGAVFALSMYYGYHISLLVGVYIGIYSLVTSIVNKSLKPIRTILVMVLSSVILLLPRLYLMIQVMRIFPRPMEEQSGFTLQGFIYFLLSWKQGIFIKMDVSSYAYEIDENSIYVGFISLALFVLFFIRNKKGIKAALPLLISLLICFWLMLGNAVTPSLYQGLKYLPIISFFRVAQRFRFDFIIPFALIAGLGLDNIKQLISKPMVTNVLTVCILIAIYINLTIFSDTNFLSKTLIIKNPEAQLPSAGAFHQTNFTKPDFPLQRTIPIPAKYINSIDTQPLSYEYLMLRENMGTLKCYDPLAYHVHASAIEEVNYQGEFYLLEPVSGVKVENTFWSPNILEYTISNPQKVAKNMLIINQDYFPGWIVRKGPFACERASVYHGLVATRLNETENHVTLEFNPILLYLRCR